MYKEFDLQLDEILNDYVDKEYANHFDCSVRIGISYDMSDHFAGTRLQPEEISEPINLQLDYFEIEDIETENDEVMHNAIKNCLNNEGENLAWQLLEEDPTMFYEI